MKSFYLFTAVLSASLFSCSEKKSASREEAVPVMSAGMVKLSPEQMKNAAIRFDVPVQKELRQAVQVTGVLDVPPQNLHSIGARVSGMVKSTTLLQGSHVHRGDVLCVLENPEFLGWQQEYSGNIARLELLEIDFRRQKGLADKNLSSQKVLQQASADYQILKAAQNALRRKLQLTGFSISEIENGNFSASLPVLAPSDGFVTAVYINTGQVVSEGTALCELVNVEHIHAELMVFEKDISRVKEGQSVEFELIASPGIRHHAKVFMVNHKISKERTVQVHAHLDEMKPEFLPNMQVSARIFTEGKKEWLVPASAIVSFAQGDAVFTATQEPGSFRSVPVRVLGSEGNFVAIRFPDDVSPATLKIVSNGAYDLKSVAEKSASPPED